jgi:hypothetical protein
VTTPPSSDGVIGAVYTEYPPVPAAAASHTAGHVKLTFPEPGTTMTFAMDSRTVHATPTPSFFQSSVGVAVPAAVWCETGEPPT